jgi:hypothetical protein
VKTVFNPVLKIIHFISFSKKLNNYNKKIDFFKDYDKSKNINGSYYI